MLWQITLDTPNENGLTTPLITGWYSLMYLEWEEGASWHRRPPHLLGTAHLLDTLIMTY